jgi:flagellin
MAMNAARNLGIVYEKLSNSTARLASGLRVISAADDAAGLAVRELMRADIAVLNQGVRNASDAISLLQTAEGALGVIDEKLIRMKELAEQAATGTYTTVQREIMDSEYQAMAAEIDRIANATDFNGIKLLNGDLSSASLHDGSGLKVHFGTGNSSANDYYFIKIGDMRATPSTGLSVGTSTTTGVTGADVWYNENALAATSGSAVSSLNGYLGFAYDYNADRSSGAAVSSQLDNIYGIFEVNSATGGTGAFDLDDLVAAINQGTASRVQINFDFTTAANSVATTFNLTSAANAHIVVGNVKVGLYASGTAASGRGSAGLDSDTDEAIRAGAVLNSNFAKALTSAINSVTDGNVFAVWNRATSGAAIMVFAREVGAAGNSLAAWESLSGAAATDSFTFSGDAGAISTTSAVGGITEGTFYGGGENWVTAEAVADDNGRYHLQITGNATGLRHDIAFFAANSAGYGGGGIFGASAATWLDSLPSYDEAATGEWIQLVDASGSAGASTSSDPGRNILTQSAAQLALSALATAIESKDKTRASLGSLQNRLDNTITQLSIQSENLQAAESRISDIDVAIEMTEFTKNMILAQAATAMLAQANGLAQLSLSLLGG